MIKKDLNTIRQLADRLKASAHLHEKRTFQPIVNMMQREIETIEEKFADEIKQLQAGKAAQELKEMKALLKTWQRDIAAEIAA